MKPKREPNAVHKLIRDAQARQVEAGRVSWLKRLLKSDQAARDARRKDNGTRGQHRA